MKQAIARFAAALALAALLPQLADAKTPPAKTPPAKAAAAPEEKDAATAEFEKFRAILEEDNPAELFEAKGEDLWKQKRGPNNVSLERCDLGLGAGVVKGAYVQTPRYFADADQVMDIERRIAWCMEKLQGFKRADLVKKPFSTDDYTPDLVSLVTYVASESRGLPVAIPQRHPKEVAAYKIGREIFQYRAGPYDFSCATCHGEDGKRIRMQQLPNLLEKRDAMRAYAGWPGYRMTGGLMHTLQWRMNDCFRQQRFPEPGYLSDAVTDLLTYLGANANGNIYKGPGIKR
ncbi:MAG: sulfur oxidation c-type cytochrome SoxA [Rhodocyclaceae bacterium]|nr:sulfur oxidation c-type cytochrome SoxA [Rhodocyclaceae bacterium]